MRVGSARGRDTESERVDFPLGLRRADTDQRCRAEGQEQQKGDWASRARLEVLSRDLERSGCAARPRFAVRGKDDLRIDRVESIKGAERDLTVVV
jgi:hypothetical protein